MDQRAHGSVELHGPGAYLVRTRVCVRLNREDLRVDRQREVVGDDVTGRARRNIEVLSTETDDRGRPGSGRAAQVEPDDRLHLLRLPGRSHVQLHDEIAAGPQRPCEIVWSERRRLARSPPEKMTAGEIG